MISSSEEREEEFEGRLCPECRKGRLVVEDGGRDLNSGQSLRAVKCTYCGSVLRLFPNGNMEVSVHGSDAVEVERVSQALFRKAQETREHKGFPIVSRLFFLLVFVVVFGAILTAARLLPFYVFPLVLTGSIVTFCVVGAFTLRGDASLSEKSFLELMRLSFRYLPLLRKRDE